MPPISDTTRDGLACPAQASGQSLSGRARHRNEDSFAIDAALGLYLVADGLGGHGHGEIASRSAVASIGRLLADASPHSCPTCGCESSYRDLLRAAIEQAQRRIRAMRERHPALRRVGTTLVALWLHEGVATIAHVGDSRAYRLAAGGLELLTEDHTWVRKQITDGFLSEREAAVHPMRNVLIQALGSRAVTVAIAEHPACPGDVYLLCTDGLNSVLDDAAIHGCLANLDAPERQCRELVRRACERGAADDVTALVVHVP